ncbi:aldehyde dehydrogenase family protein [Allosaccharopolyspora coralli]|uniref:Aldehyde dehydrogenase family protein n=1 Tax=Allosaccharopolyspora coralli TaxID=2665642 RepID=A0A5Q3Q782_9PSEU|nr:aldehyde dehydrogenase family protein [Allosaccharopolyspora coralli]QGK70193.1 aldehyde dehydrogenase family protein [Allosaccharopolyspora coralli]
MTTIQNSSSVPLRHLVGGRWIDGSGEPAHSADPAHPDVVVASYRMAGSEELDQAVRAAEVAQRCWQDLGLIQRGRILRRAAELLAERSEDIAVLMTREHGKTLPESRGEVAGSVETLHYHASRARAADGSTYPSGHPDEVVRTVRRPLGVVAAITPWNFPLQIPVWKLAPALLWGNAVVWKPASDTPAVAAAFAEVLHDAGVPAGAVNLVLGPGALGSALVARDEVAGVTFTGSDAVGRLIREAVVPRGAKLQMELGGHNAAIVLPDVDPAEAAEVLVGAVVGATGQKCTATRRVIAVGTAYDELLPELAKRFEALKVGDGSLADSQVGPVINERARAEIDHAVEQAVREGAEVVARSAARLPTDGHFVAPTVLAGTPELTICREEVFGPVVTVLRADDLDEAISIANDTRYGLTAALFTTDERAVRQGLAELDAGLIKVNSPNTGSELHAPFGGLKDSTFPAPREQNGDSSADFFTWSKTAYLRTATPRGDRS